MKRSHSQKHGGGRTSARPRRRLASARSGRARQPMESAGDDSLVAAQRREPFIEKKGGKNPTAEVCRRRCRGCREGEEKKKISVESFCFSHADDQKNFTDQVSYLHCYPVAVFSYSFSAAGKRTRFLVALLHKRHRRGLLLAASSGSSKRRRRRGGRDDVAREANAIFSNKN